MSNNTTSYNRLNRISTKTEKLGDECIKRAKGSEDLAPIKAAIASYGRSISATGMELKFKSLVRTRTKVVKRTK